jgi:co-chaperonin GroES (HSP10)
MVSVIAATCVENCLKFVDVFQKGDHISPSVKVGEKVLLPEYGGTKINFDDKVSILVIVFA